MPWPHTRPIGLVTALYAPAVGGVERYVERLATGLVRRGVPVEVITTDPGSRSPTVERREGVVVRRFPTVRDDRTYFLSPRLARWLGHNAARYELLHAHNLHTLMPVVAAWAARRCRIPLVVTGHYHGTGHTPLRRAMHVPYRPLAGIAMRSAARVITNSHAEREVLRHDFGASLPTTLVVEGIDIPMGGAGTAPAPAADPDGATGRTTLLSVGRIEGYKSVDRIVEALPHLPAEYRLVVVGDGPARRSVVETAERLGVRDRVVMRGRVPEDELRAWYASAAASVTMSLHESFGLVVLEAAAAGCPVVASDIPAFREVSGFAPDGRITVVDADATPAALADAIRAAVAHGRTPPLGSDDAGAGWRIPTWDSLVDGVLEVYEEVAAGTKTKSDT